jgi:hypothetical protein
MDESGNEVKNFFMELQKNYQIFGITLGKGTYWRL